MGLILPTENTLLYTSSHHYRNSPKYKEFILNFYYVLGKKSASERLPRALFIPTHANKKAIAGVLEVGVGLERVEFLWQDFCAISQPVLEVSKFEALNYVLKKHLTWLKSDGKTCKILLSLIIAEGKKLKTSKVEQAKKLSAPFVCWTRARNTCIVLEFSEASVKYVPLDIAGFAIKKSGRQAFDEEWSVTDYPVEKAAKLYMGYAKNNGATKECAQTLGKLAQASEKEICMIQPSAIAKAKESEEKKVSKKKPSKVTIDNGPYKPKTAKTVTRLAAQKPPKNIDGKKPTKSSTICGLILKGGLSDNEIFEQAKITAGLAENHKWYIPYYRNILIKKGLFTAAPSKLKFKPDPPSSQPKVPK